MSVSEYHFVDTNVMVYAHDLLAGEKQQRANALIEKLWASKNGCLSIQVLQEFYSVVTTKIEQPLDSEMVAQIISLLSSWRIHIPDVQDILKAIDIQSNYRISFWDALIVNSASQSGCAILWTEDLNDGQVYEGVRIQNPFKE